MVREKILKTPEYREVIYDDEHWMILNMLRKEACEIMQTLYRNNIEAYAHGSIARGDVWRGSDIDIVIPYPIPSYKLEYTLDSSNYRIHNRYIVVATPSNTPKVYYVLDEEERKVISYPLYKLKTREYEFYMFGGLIDFKKLLYNQRVPGVDKRLVFIEPTEKGHRESPVIGYENVVASKLGISIETVLERIRVLTRRDEIGRTGVFIKYELSTDESIEDALDKILREYPMIREFIDKNH